MDKYISKISMPVVNGSGETVVTTYLIKDAAAQASIEELQNKISGALHWVGFTTTNLTDGSTTSPIVINGDEYTQKAGDVTATWTTQSSATNATEFIWNGTAWQQFGTTNGFGTLAFKNSASGSYTPAGTVSTPTITLNGGSSSKLVVTTLKGVSGTTPVTRIDSASTKSTKVRVIPKPEAHQASDLAQTAVLTKGSVTGVSGSTSATKINDANPRRTIVRVIPKPVSLSADQIATTTKLETSSVTGVSGSTTASKVSPVSKKLGTTTIKGVSGTVTTHDTPTLNRERKYVLSQGPAGSNNLYYMYVTESSETLNMTMATVQSCDIGTSLTAGTAQTVATANNTATTVATGSTVDTSTTTNVGDSIIASVGTINVTVPIAAGSATTVLTGNTSTSATGPSIVTGLTGNILTQATDGTTDVQLKVLDLNESDLDGDSLTGIFGSTVSNVTVPKAATSATNVLTGSANVTVVTGLTGSVLTQTNNAGEGVSLKVVDVDGSDQDGADLSLVTGSGTESISVATANTNPTAVATGQVNASGEGASVVTALHSSATSTKPTFTGTAATITVS